MTPSAQAVWLYQVTDTENMELTEAEAKAFWPVYGRHQDDYPSGFLPSLLILPA